MMYMLLRLSAKKWYYIHEHSKIIKYKYIKPINLNFI